MEGLLVLLGLTLLAVPVLLIVALAMISGLRHRVDALERELGELQVEIATHGTSREGAPEPTLGELMREPTPRPATPPPRTAAPPSPPIPPQSKPRPTPASAPAAPSVSASPPRSATTTRPPRPAVPSRPDPLQLAARAIRRWFTEGNVPVKVGMLVLFAGVAALLKYASDQGWMTLPIELRLAGVAAAAAAALLFGWRQRDSRRSFALSLQGGAIGVLLLVVFAAFKLYPLLPAGVAFGLSVVLVAGAGVLAVKQKALALAVLGLLAGFLAPLWLSTGTGNHVALFGYYAVLNAAIFAIAWMRAWRLLNVLGFAFTFGIGTAWGVLRYRPEDFATTEPFLLLFFAFYLLIPILYARRRAAGRRDLLDGCLVFGTPLVAFSLQAGLLDGERLPLAFCALALGAIHAALAWWLRGREHFHRLVAPYAVLALGFATLAVPLALSAQATAAVFALEGAGLAWLGLRQHSRRQQWTGGALQVAAAIAFAIAVDGLPIASVGIVNAAFMAGLLIALGGFASAWSYRRAQPGSQASVVYYLWALAWWLGTALHEIDQYVLDELAPDYVLALAAITGWLASETHRRLPSAALAWTATLAVMAAVPLALAQHEAHAWPVGGYGLAAWALFAITGWRMLGSLRAEGGSMPGLAHSAWLIAWTLMLALSLQHLVERLAIAGSWEWTAFALPWLALAALLQWRSQLLAPPMGERFGQWRDSIHGLVVALLALGWLLALWQPGHSAPLPWLPVLNPLGLMQLAALALLAAWWRTPAAGELARWRVPVLAAAGFALVSVEVLRACRHWGDVPWSDAMFSTSLVQTSLTVVWSLLGVFGWIVGSRRGQRALWLAGAVLMAVVLAKLLLVDRQHLGNLLGIVSFIAYGLLCTVVGYFAPAPPRAGAQEFELGEEAAQ
ncbi:DUF2339 domain-containing protein [Novilysobacter erysipheiresistens]|uniref:DUF2339 domain-containing protein n=1 Tax=Novilysobacter erysipheiresistens TaxID=1749332 RepID=A0ABU7Z184_9GAMM